MPLSGMKSMPDDGNDAVVLSWDVSRDICSEIVQGVRVIEPGIGFDTKWSREGVVVGGIVSEVIVYSLRIGDKSSAIDV